jgi:HemY protein
LQKAADQSGGSDLAVGLTQAELLLSANQFDQAIETLSKLNSIDPTHGTVLKLLHQTYQHIGDWEGLLKLIPSLYKNKVLMEAEVKLLETETFSRLLKQAAVSNDQARIQTVWESVPPYIQSLRDIFTIYFAAMITASAGEKIEELLVKKVSEHWSDTLVEIFSSIENTNLANQLVIAERWLLSYPDNAVLLRALGKICIRNQNTEKAMKYLSRSLDTEPTVAAYQMLGDLFFAMDDKDKACKCYKHGLELAASDVVSHAETLSK